jgi:uncharacterized protein (TIGR04255 family)
MLSKGPTFSNPPLVETAISLQFDPIEGFCNAHLGLFWEQAGLAKDFVRLNDAPLIEQQLERFGSEQSFFPPGPWLRVNAGGGSARLQATTRSEERVIQIQNGRLVHNWRRIGTGGYPRFAANLPEFMGVVELLSAFVKKGFGNPIPWNQWEVVYVNMIEQEGLWASPSDWPSVLPAIFGDAGSAGPGPLDSASGSWRFELPDRQGRLHLEVQHLRGGPQASANQRMLLQLTARGPVKGQGATDLEAGLNLGHDSVVQTFVRVSSEKAQTQWGRQS